MLDNIAVSETSSDKINNPSQQIKTQQVPQPLPIPVDHHPKEHMLPVQNININLSTQTNYNEVLVKYDTTDNKFIIYDKNRILLGSLSIIQFIKYITFNTSKNFLKLYDHESAVNVIEKYFCKCSKMTNKVTLLGHLESPIMGSLEMVLKLYSGVNTFASSSLKNELEKMGEEKEVATTIQNKIKEVVYLILNHALKLIVNIFDAIQNDPTKNEIKSMLIKYSIFIVNKINHYIKESTDIKVYGCKNLEVQIVQLEKIKSDTNKKLSTLEEIIKTQNEKINKILDYMDINNFDAILERSNNLETNTDTDTDSNKISNVHNKIEQIQKIVNEQNGNINDIDYKESDYSYTESGDKKGNIDYLTPKEEN
jgi:hypothetical protein